MLTFESARVRAWSHLTGGMEVVVSQATTVEELTELLTETPWSGPSIDTAGAPLTREDFLAAVEALGAAPYVPFAPKFYVGPAQHEQMARVRDFLARRWISPWYKPRASERWLREERGMKDRPRRFHTPPQPKRARVRELGRPRLVHVLSSWTRWDE